MHLLFIKLSKEGLLEDLITILTAAGLEHACVLEASTIQQFMGRNIPLFASLRTELGSSPTYCKVIFARIPEQESLEELKRLLKRSKIDLNDEDVGAALIMPCEKI